MTTSSTLREAATALREAEAGLAKGDCSAAHEALRALARTSYRSLTDFEHDVTAGVTGAPLRDRLTWWREQLDEARLQVALAEMETRETRAEVLDLVQRHLEPFSGAMATAVADMTSALADLRKELRDLQDRLPEPVAQR